MGESHQASK